MSPIKTSVSSPSTPGPNPLMSQGIICNGMIYCSGSLGVAPKTGKFVEGTVTDRTIQALRNLEQVLKAGGSEINKVVKVNIFLSSLDHYSAVNEGYAKVFIEDPKPCRTCVAVSQLPMNAEVEIEAIAAI